MKILLIASEIGLDKGGMAYSCFRVKEILSKKHTVTVLNSKSFPVKTIKDGVTPQTRHGILMEYKLKEECRKYSDVDIIIGYGAKRNGYYAALLANRISKPYILRLCGSDINLAKWSVEQEWMLLKACESACKIVCLSNEMAKNVVNLMPESSQKIEIISNEVRRQVSKVSFINLPNKLIVGCAATELNEKKGIANLLCMIAEFKKMSSLCIRCELVGAVDEPALNQYNQMIDNLGLKKDIYFYGKKTRDELAVIMKNWDFYIQASVAEGHPNSVLEAWRNGIAFISSSTGFIAETLQHDYPDMFFKSWNPTEMALHLKYLVEKSDKVDMYNIAYRYHQSLSYPEIIEEKWLQLISFSDSRKCIIPGGDYVIALGLHDVDLENNDSITVSLEKFTRFVKKIYDSGLKLCSMREYILLSENEKKRSIVCTFDDGYENIKIYALPVLKKYGFTATVFVCTEYFGQYNRWNYKDTIIRKHMTKDDIVELVDCGWEIGSHGKTHQNLLKLFETDVEEELSVSKKIIESITGNIVISYAYPYGGFNNHILKLVKKYYQYAFAVDKGGASMIADNLQIRRYDIDDINRMIRLE